MVFSDSFCVGCSTVNCVSPHLITLIYIPWIIADIIVGLVWRLLVIPDYGLLSGITQNPAIFPPDGHLHPHRRAAPPLVWRFPAGALPWSI